MMLLSEAIRLGVMLRPQAFHVRYDDKGGSCAIGAARDAIGDRERPVHILWPYMDEIMDCPACGLRDTCLVPHLNDRHRWSREQIADWVEGIERERGLIAQTESMLDVLGALAAPIQEEK